MPVDMRARIGQVELPNLVLTASGCAGAGRELAQFAALAGVGELNVGADLDFLVGASGDQVTRESH